MRRLGKRRARRIDVRDHKIVVVLDRRGATIWHDDNADPRDVADELCSLAAALSAGVAQGMGEL